MHSVACVAGRRRRKVGKSKWAREREGTRSSRVRSSPASRACVCPFPPLRTPATQATDVPSVFTFHWRLHVQFSPIIKLFDWRERSAWDRLVCTLNLKFCKRPNRYKFLKLPKRRSLCHEVLKHSELFWSWYSPSVVSSKWWNRQLTLKCKFKCYVKPMKDPLGVSPSKGITVPHEVKKKLFWPRWDSHPRGPD